MIPTKGDGDMGQDGADREGRKLTEIDILKY